MNSYLEKDKEYGTALNDHVTKYKEQFDRVSIDLGTNDEQAIGRFAMLPWRSVTITGDRRFKPEQVQNVEGLEMEAAPQPKDFRHWEE